MENVQERPQIRKVMERESALKVLNEIKEQIGCTDFASICEDDLEIKPEDKLTQSIIHAIMCGLVFFDEEKNCIVQKLIRPIKKGEQTADELHYKYRLNITKLRGTKATTEIDFLLQILSQITGRSEHLVGELSGKDVDIAAGCISFFEQ